jgi:protein-disulfide isomerase
MMKRVWKSIEPVRLKLWRSLWSAIPSSRGLVASLLVALMLSLGWRWLPAHASPAISPQLREQVLQIIRENPEVILDAVQAYRKKQQDEQQAARQKVLQKFVSDPKAAIAQSPTTGAKSGKILLVEFSDFQCPYCAKAQDAVKTFMAKHGDSVTLVFKHLPLTSIHPEALPAAKAAWAAGQQGKFWQFQQALFANQRQLSDEFYQQTAQSLGLDVAKFDRDRASTAAATAINQDLALAEQLGIEGTPFFVLNGKALPGVVQLEDLETLLQSAQ